MTGMASNGHERYKNARVEGAKTDAEVQDWHDEHPEAFVAGVQYALDQMLGALESRGLIDKNNFEHHLAIDILDKAKTGRPR